MRVSTLGDEIPCKVEVGGFVGDGVETEEGEFDFWVAGVAVDLVRAGAEGVGEEGDVFCDGAEEEIVSVVEVVDVGCFDEVTGVISLEMVS
jgi:hypothetical protein